MHIVLYGATSAIAHEIAKSYAKEKCHSFILVGRNEQRLQSCKLELIALGAVTVTTVTMDVTNSDSILNTTKNIIETSKSIDIAILAHGSLSNQDLASIDMNYLQSEFTINAVSFLLISQLIVNHFTLIGKGILIGLSSVAGERGRKGNYAYGSAKSAVTTFLSGLRHRNTNKDIHIMTIKPGFVSTPMTAHLPQSFLFVQPGFIAKEIRRGIDQGIENMYIPSYWRLIMMIVRSLPEIIFNKINI